MKRLERRCPKCNDLLIYRSKWGYRQSILKNTVCVRCVNRKHDFYKNIEIINGKKFYKKVCFECHKTEMRFSTIQGLRWSLKHNGICKLCKSSKRNILYKRNCPSCNKELVTYNKYWYKLAIEENRLCLRCCSRGKIVSHETKLKMRLNHADFNGRKNPFFRRKHTIESKKLITAANKGKNRFSKEYIEKMKINMKGSGNHFYGKTHTKKTKKILGRPKSKEHMLKLRAANLGRKSPLKGIKLSDDFRRKMRISAIKRIKRERFGKKMFLPSVNKNENKYFSKLELERGWDGIFHGKNEKMVQYHIKHLGYFPDYYEPNLNIIVEYDEIKHYKEDALTLKDKDIYRQNQIIKHLQCRFFRYNEFMDVFYEVFYESIVQEIRK